MNFAPPPSIDWTMLTPVIVVTVTGLVALLIEMLRPKHNNNGIVAASLIGLAITGYALFTQLGLPDGETFAGMVLRDRASLILQLLLVGTCFLTVLFSEGYLREKRIPFGEFYPLALWSTAGAMIMVSTNSLLMLFLGLEVLSIALYVMAGMSRQESKSEESAIKYFLLGAFASAFLLYGIAFLYGATGTIRLDEIGPVWSQGQDWVQNLLIFGLGLVLVGMFFKAALVPFHQWTPDVYQGAPTNVTAFMAAGSKIAAVGALYRILDEASPMVHLWEPILYWVAILSMVVGNLIALTQKDVKRTLAFSSIANAGYVLVAILAHLKAPDQVGMGATMFFLASYAVMTVGSFAVVSMAAKDGQEGTRFSDLHGLYQRSPWAAGTLLVFVCSLIGIPPTAGFFAKLLIFNDALTAGLTPLAIVLALTSVISVYYYLGIVRAAMIADEGASRNRSMPLNAGLTAAITACVIGVFALTAAIQPIQDLAAKQPAGYVEVEPKGAVPARPSMSGP